MFTNVRCETESHKMETEPLLKIKITAQCGSTTETSNSPTDLQGLSQFLSTALLSSQSRLYGVLDDAAHVIHVAESAARAECFDVVHQDLTQRAKDLHVSQDEDPVEI